MSDTFFRYAAIEGFKHDMFVESFVFFFVGLITIIISLYFLFSCIKKQKDNILDFQDAMHYYCLVAIVIIISFFIMDFQWIQILLYPKSFMAQYLN